MGIAAAAGRSLGEDLFVVGDEGESQDYCHAILDSGLLMLLTVQPTRTGFSRFLNKSHDDAAANKGFLWASIRQYNLLVINTHLQASGGDEVRLRQLREIFDFLSDFMSDHADV